MNHNIKHLLLLFFCFTWCQLFGQAEATQNFSFDGAVYDVIVMKASDAPKFSFWQNVNLDEHLNVLNALKPQEPFFIINASISDTTCLPLGLFIKDGKEIRSLNTSTGAGNFYFTDNGCLLFYKDNIEIVNANAYQPDPGIVNGIQSGPLLIDNFKINSALPKNSKNLKRRCGVGLFTTSRGEKFVLFCSSRTEVSFYDFANFMLQYKNVRVGLCLESAGCGMYFPDLEPETQPANHIICNYIFYRM